MAIIESIQNLNKSYKRSQQTEPEQTIGSDADEEIHLIACTSGGAGVGAGADRLHKTNKSAKET
jgi:hypothetical protein